MINFKSDVKCVISHHEQFCFCMSYQKMEKLPKDQMTKMVVPPLLVPVRSGHQNLQKVARTANGVDGTSCFQCQQLSQQPWAVTAVPTVGRSTWRWASMFFQRNHQRWNHHRIIRSRAWQKEMESNPIRYWWCQCRNDSFEESNCASKGFVDEHLPRSMLTFTFLWM